MDWKRFVLIFLFIVGYLKCIKMKMSVGPIGEDSQPKKTVVTELTVAIQKRVTWSLCNCRVKPR